MLDSTFELISLAASNSLAVFCVCNLIIAILLVGSSKPSPQKQLTRFPWDVNDVNIKKSSPVISSCDHEAKNVAVEEEDEEEVVSSSSVSITTIHYEEEEGEIPDEDDELRRRAEEFIDKINRGWRAEKSNTFTISH